jgi:hypothetical protein
LRDKKKIRKDKGLSIRQGSPLLLLPLPHRRLSRHNKLQTNSQQILQLLQHSRTMNDALNELSSMGNCKDYEGMEEFDFAQVYVKP